MDVVTSIPTVRADMLQWGHGREAMDGCGGGDYVGWQAALQWGHGREAMDGVAARPAPRPAPNGFNGAMAVRPWMVFQGLDEEVEHDLLQWGHGREAMDGLCLSDAVAVELQLQWGHGREAMDGIDSPLRLAVDCVKLQWGHGREAMDGASTSCMPGGAPMLQWGHGREAMDGPSPRRAWRQPRQASMGPWP